MADMSEPGRAPIRDPGRAAAFSDAVVAVAMTALVLPLLDIDVSSLTTLGQLWGEFGDQFTAFLLSFFIIAMYWMVHHKVWFALRTVTPGLLWLNMFWLLGVLLIPFASVTLDESANFPVIGFQIYSAVVFVTSLTLGLMINLITSRPSLNIGGVVPQPLWFSLRFAGWWLLVFVGCVVNAQGIGQYLLELTAAPMVFFGYWRPASLRRKAAAMQESGVDVVLG